MQRTSNTTRGWRSLVVAFMLLGSLGRPACAQSTAIVCELPTFQLNVSTWGTFAVSNTQNMLTSITAPGYPSYHLLVQVPKQIAIKNGSGVTKYTANVTVAPPGGVGLTDGGSVWTLDMPGPGGGPDPVAHVVPVTVTIPSRTWTYADLAGAYTGQVYLTLTAPAS